MYVQRYNSIKKNHNYVTFLHSVVIYHKFSVKIYGFCFAFSFSLFACKTYVLAWIYLIFDLGKESVSEDQTIWEIKPIVCFTNATSRKLPLEVISNI